MSKKQKPDMIQFGFPQDHVRFQQAKGTTRVGWEIFDKKTRKWKPWKPTVDRIEVELEQKRK